MNSREEEYLLKTVIFGSSTIGKTSLLRRYASGEYSEN
jgi:GTPase SAR1 family protein